MIALLDNTILEIAADMQIPTSQQIAAGDGLAGVLHQHTQQVELPPVQGDGLAGVLILRLHSGQAWSVVRSSTMSPTAMQPAGM